MKPARFIFNSDYSTVRKTGEIEMSITIPDYIDVPETADSSSKPYVIGRVVKNIGDSKHTYATYLTSSRYDYATMGWSGATKPDGATATSSIWGEETSDRISIGLYIYGNTAEFVIDYPRGAYKSEGESLILRGYGQTITAHILTYKDPFSE